MARVHDYDDAAASREEIVLRYGGETYTLPPEAPIDVAIEWYRIQGAEKMSAAERMRLNYTLVFGEIVFDLLKANGVPFPKVDAMYRDVLDEWGLWRKPTGRTQLVAGLVERLRAAAGNRERVLELVEELEVIYADPAGDEEREPEEVVSGGS